MANPSIVVNFKANTADLQKGIKDAEQGTKSFGSKLKSLGKTGALAAGAAGVGALVYTLKTGISEYAQSSKVAAQTNAVIKSTGKAANVSAKEVSDLAESLMKKSGVDDEAIASGENLLLTFTNIRNEAGKGNDVFNQTTKAALDMSVALGTDVTNAAMQLGKALNDPVKGMTKLQRSGVTFTDAQKEQVKALQASGKTLEAQKIILAEVNKEFGGSAEAAGKTLPGQLAIARESFNNFAGMLIEKMIPILEQAVAFIREHWPEISAVIKETWNATRPILIALGEIIVEIVKLIRDNWGTIGPVVMGFARIVETAAKIIAAVLRLVAAVIRGDWSEAWKQLQNIAKLAIDQVVNFLKLYAAVGGLLYRVAVALGKAILEGLRDGLAGIGNAAWNLVNNIGEAITNQMGAIVGWGRKIGAGIKNGVVAGFEGISGALAAALKAGLNLVIAAWNRIGIPGFKVNMPKPIPDVKIPGIPFPDIPFLAKGGIVTAPTLAMVGEAGPEAVIPLGSRGAIEVRVFIGDTELRGLVRSEVRTENNRTAQTLLAGAI
jgi:hypothetical protein